MRISRNLLAICTAIAVCGIAVFGSNVRGQSDTRLPDPTREESFFGQTPPGEKAEAFAPEVLIYEAHDSPIIPPDENWILWHSMDVDVLFYGMVDGHLTTIENPLGIEFPEVCNGVAISPSSKFCEPSPIIMEGTGVS